MATDRFIDKLCGHGHVDRRVRGREQGVCDGSARSPVRVCVGDVYTQGVCTGVCVYV